MSESWGRYPKVLQRVVKPAWLSDLPIQIKSGTILPQGLARSYGDSCLNDGGTIVSTTALNRIVSFDRERGLLTAEAGISLTEILNVIVPSGWFIPVSPGTQFVTLGGAIANDIHGKNHHVEGTFGRHIQSLELMRSDGTLMKCSAEENSDMFSATIGGLGLTGIITTAVLKLKKVESAFIDSEAIQFCGLDEFFSISEESDQAFEYTVAWLDCISTGEDFARGIFYRGNHATAEQARGKKAGGLIPRVPVPIDLPAFMLNKYSMSAFNSLYYRKQLSKKVEKIVHYEPFFYPLDAVYDWNKIYGKRGFFQFQFVVPKVKGHVFLKTILERVVRSGKASFLAVLKEFGSLSSPGMLSFPREGVTMCLDFANEGKTTLSFMNELDTMVRESGGALYPAKDACMPAESFKRYCPRWDEFESFIDPMHSSSFWRRVTAENG